MARRRRSYRANKDNLVGTFINNSIVDSKKKAKEKQRAENREIKAAQRELKERIKKEAAERKALEKIEKRKLADEKKYNDRIEKYKSKLRSKFENTNIYCSDALHSEIAFACYERSISIGSIFTKYVNAREDDIRKRSLELFLEENLPLGYTSCATFNALNINLESLLNEEPIVPNLSNVALSSPEFLACKTEAMQREESRTAFIQNAELKLFEDDFDALVQRANFEYLSGEELQQTDEFIQGQTTKKGYVDGVEKKISELTHLSREELNS